MVNKLLVQGLEIQQARADFTAGGMVFGAGSYVVSMAQPKMGVARYLLGRTLYPDNTLHPRSRGQPDPAVRHGDRHHVRVHGRSRRAGRRSR